MIPRLSSAIKDDELVVFIESDDEFTLAKKGIIRKYSQLFSYMRDYTQDIRLQFQEHFKKIEDYNISLVSNLAQITKKDLGEIVESLEHLMREIHKISVSGFSETQFDKKLFSIFDQSILKDIIYHFEKKYCGTKGQLFSTNQNNYVSIISPSTIIAFRNAYDHWTKIDEETLEQLNVNLKNFRLRLNSIKYIPCVLATISYILNDLSVFDGGNPPKNIDDIWMNLDTDLGTKNMSFETLKNLRKRDWGTSKQQYVDRLGRKNQLFKRLKNSQIVTIHGEGGIGKTELVLQTLNEMVDPEGEFGGFEFDFLLPFTFKGNEQGEYRHDGEIVDVNHSGWEAIPEFSQIIDTLSKLNSNPLIDGTSKKEIFDRAVDFLVTNSVCLVIDNLETVDYGDRTTQIDELLNAFYEKSEITSAKSRIIITTRVQPSTVRVGERYALEYLNSAEMTNLARERANWLYSQDPSLHNSPDKILSKTDWEGLETFLQSNLNTDSKREIGGHPLVIFIAVYEAMEKNSGLKLTDVITKIVNEADKELDTNLTNLFEYITEKSFGFIENIEDVAPILSNLCTMVEFETRVVKEHCETNRKLDHRSIIRNLLQIELIRKIPNQVTEKYEFRSRYHAKLLREHLHQSYEIPSPQTNAVLHKWVLLWTERLFQNPVIIDGKNIKSYETHPSSSIKEIDNSKFELFQSIDYTQIDEETLSLFSNLLPRCLDILANFNQNVNMKMNIQNTTSSSNKNVIIRFVEQLTASIIGVFQGVIYEKGPNDLNTLSNFIIKSWNHGLSSLDILVQQALNVYVDTFENIREKNTDLLNIWKRIELNEVQVTTLLSAKVSMLVFSKFGPKIDYNISKFLLELDYDQDEIEKYREVFQPLPSMLAKIPSKEISENLALLIKRLSVETETEDIFSINKQNIINVENYFKKGIHSQSYRSKINNSTQLKILYCPEDISDKSLGIKYIILSVEEKMSFNDDSLSEDSTIITGLFVEAFAAETQKKMEINQKKDNVQTSQIRDITSLSVNEMFEILYSIEFGTIDASQLLGPILKSVLKERGIVGKWGKWKKSKIIQGESFELFITRISKNNLIARERQEGVFEIIKTVQTVPTDYYRFLKEQRNLWVHSKLQKKIVTKNYSRIMKAIKDKTKKHRDESE